MFRRLAMSIVIWLAVALLFAQSNAGIGLVIATLAAVIFLFYPRANGSSRASKNGHWSIDKNGPVWKEE